MLSGRECFPGGGRVCYLMGDYQVELKPTGNKYFPTYMANSRAAPRLGVDRTQMVESLEREVRAHFST